MINQDHLRLSLSRQCQVVSMSRALFCRQRVGETPKTFKLMNVIDKPFTAMCWHDSRQMTWHLRRQGCCVGRKRVRRLMARLAYSRSTRPARRINQHCIHSYVLRHLAIKRPDQVWCANLTFNLMRRGFLYHVAIMDWFSLKVLAWRLPNTMDADFASRLWNRRLSATAGRPLQHRSGLAVRKLRPHDKRRMYPRLDETGATLEWTTSSFSGHGAASNTSASSSTPSNAVAMREAASAPDRLLHRQRPQPIFNSRTPDEVYAMSTMTQQFAASSKPDLPLPSRQTVSSGGTTSNGT